jgi:hypothetical protein
MAQEECPRSRAKGKCRPYNGKGYVSTGGSPDRYHAGQKTECRLCGGAGKCQRCGGSGYVGN